MATKVVLSQPSIVDAIKEYKERYARTTPATLNPVSQALLTAVADPAPRLRRNTKRFDLFVPSDKAKARAERWVARNLAGA